MYDQLMGSSEWLGFKQPRDLGITLLASTSLGLRGCGQQFPSHGVLLSVRQLKHKCQISTYISWGEPRSLVTLTAELLFKLLLFLLDCLSLFLHSFLQLLTDGVYSLELKALVS